MSKLIIINKELSGPVFIGGKKFEFKNGVTIIDSTDEDTVARVKKLESLGYKIIPYESYAKAKAEKEQKQKEIEHQTEQPAQQEEQPAQQEEQPAQQEEQPAQQEEQPAQQEEQPTTSKKRSKK